MKYKLSFVLALQVFYQILFSQPCIEGVINHYTPIKDFDCDGNIAIVQSAAAFHPGDLVLLIQMQGADCILENNTTFGDITTIGSAGNYEINRIKSIENEGITFKYQRTRDYNINGKVQLVYIPEFEKVTICDLTCPEWNGETGGILIISVSDSLIMEGEINVSAKGFRGGAILNGSTAANHQTDFYYTPDPIVSALKGEGICQIPYSFSSGRGKVGNAGGGGNGHNAGGGGGGSFGNGGRGGMEFSHTVSDPNTFGVGGGNTTEHITKLFLGGGGGAGHSNDYTGTPGGKGGGIALILADKIIHNGNKIVSNGENIYGGNNNNDGQGGGGAGGTIAIWSNHIDSPPLLLEAKGGRGGNSIFQPAPSQKIGPGGGGGGGGAILYHNTTGIDGDYSGGAHGVTNGNDGFGAAQGMIGTQFSNLDIPLDTLFFELVLSDSVAFCEGSSIIFNGNSYTQPSIITDTLEASGGMCDTIRYTYLIWKNFELKSDIYYICPGESIEIRGNKYDSPIVLMDTINGFIGCDTVHRVEIKWIVIPQITQDTFICAGAKIQIDDTYYHPGDVIIDTLTFTERCDTIKIINVLEYPFLGQDFLPHAVVFCPEEILQLESPFPETTWNNSISGKQFIINSSDDVTVKFIDTYGCLHFDTVTVKSCCNENTIFVPNAFSPDSEPPNHQFRPYSKEPCTNYKLSLYDRWGALLFSTNDPDQGWDGTFRNKKCEAGVYIWILEVAQVGQNKSERLKGDVTLIR
jgi:gliding motility-associated-like protein